MNCIVAKIQFRIFENSSWFRQTWIHHHVDISPWERKEAPQTNINSSKIQHKFHQHQCRHSTSPKDSAKESGKKRENLRSASWPFLSSINLVHKSSMQKIRKIENNPLNMTFFLVRNDIFDFFSDIISDGSRER